MGLQPVRPEVGMVEQIVLIRPADQQKRFALVLPVIGILGPRPDAIRVVGQRGNARAEDGARAGQAGGTADEGCQPECRD
jgi:hypothetical protein